MAPQLAPPFFESSHWAMLHSPRLGSMPLCLLGFHIQNLGRIFDLPPTCICIFSHQLYVGPIFSPTPYKNIPMQFPTTPKTLH